MLYNYFADKEDLLAHALLAHVGNVMTAMPRLLPQAGTGTVAENLGWFIAAESDTLTRVTPAFAGLMSQPGVLIRFHAMVGGAPAFGAAGPQDGAAEGRPEPREEPGEERDGPRGLPDILRGYLRAEQRLGRVGRAVDIEATVALVVGTVHGEVLPRMLFAAPGSQVTISSGPAGPDSADRHGGHRAPAAPRGLGLRREPCRRIDVTGWWRHGEQPCDVGGIVIH